MNKLGLEDRKFITLQLRGGVRPGITQGHHADLDTGTLCHIPRLTHDRL